MFKKLTSVFILSVFALLQTTPAICATTNTKKDSYYKVEHIKGYKNATIDTVEIYADEAIIKKGNVLKINFDTKFNSKTAQECDEVLFTFKKPLVTEEGTVLIPSGANIVGVVNKVEKPRVFNKNAKVYMTFNKLKLADGREYSIYASPANKNKVLKKSAWAALGKGFFWTAGLLGVGAGIGAGIGAAAHAVGVGCFAIGMPVGAGIGLIIGFVTPGLHYKAKVGKKAYIFLEEDLHIELTNCNE